MLGGVVRLVDHETFAHFALTVVSFPGLVVFFDDHGGGFLERFEDGLVNGDGVFEDLAAVVGAKTLKLLNHIILHNNTISLITTTYHSLVLTRHQIHVIYGRTHSVTDTPLLFLTELHVVELN